MAHAPKKTYSRLENGLFDSFEKEKENVDPFDVLLASPLKHEVQFKPLGFWGKKVRDLESKKKKEVKCGLYEANDSDEFNLSWRKPKPRTVQPKCKLSKLGDRRKNHSTSYSFTKKGKQQVLPNECIKFAKDIVVCKDPENKNEILNFSCKSCSGFKCKNKQSSCGNFIKSCENPNKTLESVKLKDNKISVNNLEFGIYRCNSSAKPLKSNQESISSKLSDDSKNKTVLFNESTEVTVHCNEDMEETLVNFNESTEVTRYCNEDMEETLVNRNENLEATLVNYDESSEETSVNCNENLEATLVNYDESSEETSVNCNENLEATLVNYDENLEATLVNYDESSEETSVNCSENLEETLVNYNESLGESSVLFSKHWGMFKYVTLKRHINFPKCLSYDNSPVSDNFNLSKTTPIRTWNEENEITSSVSLNTSEDNFTQVDLSGNICGSVDNSLYFNYYPEDSVSQVDGDESAIMLEPLGDRFSNDFDFKYFSNRELEDVIEELLEEESEDMLAEISTTSDDTSSEQETVIKISPGTEEKKSLNAAAIAASDAENDAYFGSSPNGVSLLTTGISDLSLSQVTEIVNGGTEKLVNVQSSNYKDKEDTSFYTDLTNITTKRGGFLNEKSDSRIIDAQCANLREVTEDSEFDNPLELSCIPNRMSIDCNKSVLFGNPVFESTRVFDMGPMDVGKPQKRCNPAEKLHSILQETPSQLDHSYALKPGKKWIRSMSVLKRIQSGNLPGGPLESTKITGRKFESFVQDLLKMQNEKTNLFATATDFTLPKKTSDRLRSDGTFIECRSPREDEYAELDDSVFSKTFSHKADLGKSLLHHTVKVVNFEDSSSAFRTALGLDSNRSIIQANISGADANRQMQSGISAKDFILTQCGQEDVLPFEEYFNEKTLPGCRKIGEGVYGEVFMCSETVIKIIPIEGSRQVNGAPQKNFEEIISEVVIASQLSNLREGDSNRTDGFSELKRCWCVKGKYPEYLLKLWNEYDQSGSGSENDSPIIFKEDQLYIILELANGGKDLESFVFSSSQQTLSAFIQIAFTLAAAENAFQFEHRDLHWGNVLISKANDKFTSIVLDNVEYKIPTKGVKICIIDFTLSRINHNGCCIFNDLSSDPELFTSHGDYQFEIYRMMLTELKNDWSMFNPKTNVFWLHYVVDKMIKMVRYKIRNSKTHKKHMKDLNNLESIVLDYKDSRSFVLSRSLNDVLSQL